MMKSRLLTIFFIFCGSLCCIHAQTFTIAEDITVETTGETYIQLAGNLVETSTGYLKGKVSSGARDEVISFAGLTLSPGMNGTIIRNTGTEYGKLNGEGANMLRYYELNNTGSAITPNVTVAYVATGTHREEGPPPSGPYLSGPYFIYNYNNPDWAAYGDGSSATPIVGNLVSIGTGASDLVFSEGIKINSKIFLEGSYDDVSGEMRTTINSSIPLTSPYTEDARTVSSIPPASAVDWVLVEVRATTDGAALGYRSCFLKSDGCLIADDGSYDIGLAWIPGGYYVVVRHRNHLAIMSNALVTGFTWGSSTDHDFSTAQTQAYGSNPMILVDSSPTVYGCYAGDANNDGVVKYNGSSNDKNAILAEVGLYTLNNVITAYSSNDVNMDGLVKYNGSSNDKNKVLGTVGLYTLNNIITTQIP